MKIRTKLLVITSYSIHYTKLYDLNLTAAGNGTQQGKEYLKRLTESDDAIARLDSEIEAARKALDAANRAFASYLSGLEL